MHYIVLVIRGGAGEFPAGRCEMINKKVGALLIFFIMGCAGIVSAYNPPAGGEDVHDLSSVSTLASGASVTDTEDVEPGVYNPAAGGIRERFSLGVTYLGLLGSDGTSVGWHGHGGSLNLIFPTIFGNFMGGVRFYHSPLTGMDIGTYGTIRLGYSREFFENFFLGGSAIVKIGNKDITTFGIAADLGFLYTPGDLAFMKNFAWGIVLKEFGLWFDPDTDAVGDNRSPSPPPFTPGTGVSFNLFEAPVIGLRFRTDVSFPTFSNFKAGFGANVYIKNIVTLKTGFHIDVAQIVNPAITARSFVPSFGVQFNLSDILDGDAGRPGSRNDGIKSEIAAAPFMNGAWGLGIGAEVIVGKVDEEPPVISIMYPEDVYVSPNNDGVQDYLELPIAITDPSYIESFNLKIYNKQGELVKIIRNKDTRPENKTISGVVKRIGTADTGISVPESLLWDGSTEEGEPASDGAYTFTLEATDLKGNQGVSSTYTVHLDATAPAVDIDRPPAYDRIFSPNNDGNKDTLAIVQSGSTEPQWDGKIINQENETVKMFSFNDEKPEEIVWDGTNEEGKLLPDGVYRYVIEGRDKAGNSTTATMENIIVNTTATAVFITVDSKAFSPNGDDLFDTVNLHPIVNIVEGIVSWQIVMQHETKGDLFVYEGESEIPEKLVWNGTDRDGEVVEGRYRASLQVTYENGNMPEAETRPFLLDIRPPQVNADVHPKPFSPDNDGVDDELFIDLSIKELTGVDQWTLRIKDPKGAEFDTIEGEGRPAETLRWEGYSSTGELVQSAEDYPFTLTIGDVVGNEAEYDGVIPVDVLVIREDGKLKIRISNITFAPNSPELVSEEIDKAEKNIKVLSRIAEILKKYDSYSVRIEGHAVRVNWQDEESGEQEEREELAPLSLARAESVRDALIELGVNPGRLSTAGLGGRDPVVPHSDLENRWKNRRVEFILIK